MFYKHDGAIVVEIPDSLVDAGLFSIFTQFNDVRVVVPSGSFTIRVAGRAKLWKAAFHALQNNYK